MSKTKVIFDRIWSTSMIVINTAYGILLTLFAFFALTADSYNVERYVTGFIVGTIAIIVVNGINFITRKYLKSY